MAPGETPPDRKGNDMPHLALEIEDGIATVTFDNPPLSVMTPQTIHELHELLPQLEKSEVRAVVVTGASPDFFVRHFSVEELSENTRGGGTTWKVSIDDVLLRLENLAKPVITALNGTALGGGLEFALATDIRVAKDGPFLFGLPEITVGILPGGGGTQRLSALLGRHRAKLMMWRAKLVGPGEALEIGLIDELVDRTSNESALERARSIAREITSRPPLAVAHIKRLARESAHPVTREMLALESRLFLELMQTDEAKALLAEVAAQHRKERQD